MEIDNNIELKTFNKNLLLKKCKRCSIEFNTKSKNQVYCSEKCCLDFNRERAKSRYSTNNFKFNTEHHIKIDKIKKESGAETPNFSCSSVNPDMILKGNYIEMELYGHNTFKNKSRWYKDMEKTRKKILIMSIRNDLKGLFDEIYVFDEEIKPIKEFYQKYSDKGGEQS